SKAIEQTVTDPGLIVACAEFLMEFDEYAHAAEVLKGNLRKGLATDAWAHEALAVALTASKGSQAEIERAAVSSIDLDPADGKAYLKAAKAEAGFGNHAQAVAFCKRASKCIPDDPTPYANALAYAERATDIKTDAVLWAADGLLKRDWNTNDGIDYHKQANERLPRLETKLKAAGQKTDDLKKVLTEQTQRDLVIELLWQGNADLDLVIAEPPGSVCSATNKRTTGGGVLKADLLEQSAQKDRTEVYTAASAFAGSYQVTVKRALGDPIRRPTLKVTKYKGTPQEKVDLIDVPAYGKPLEIKLENGSRTALAVVSEEVDTMADLRRDTTGSAPDHLASGFGGGFGAAGSVLGESVAGGSSLPLVAPAREKREAGISPTAADIRATYKMNPDQKSFSITVNPVFTGKGEVTMPKVPLLPGAEG
ncbi:MAG: hypothetical protein K2V38_08775, partial [Gemmataceae bacterium]|nr:hypothetical protein [Gemmataceae bacterium]